MPKEAFIMVTDADRAGLVDALALTADLTTKSFRSADEAIQAVLATAQQITGLETTLMTNIHKADSALQVIAAYNNDPALNVPAGLQIPLTMSPCRNVAGSDRPFVSADMRQDAELAALPAAKDLGACAYVGVPVFLADGAFYGTLVGLGTTPRDDLDRHIQWMQILAQVAAFQIERQRASQVASN
jgi:GAF domain-containing protein